MSNRPSEHANRRGMYWPSPRLLYIGSLPVERTSAGQMQLYRLLHGIDPERLCIVESGGEHKQDTDRRLNGVRYEQMPPFIRRGWGFARRRSVELFCSMLQIETLVQARRIAGMMTEWRPEAVLTIHEEFGWLTAANVARLLGVPLHLILHDDWFRNEDKRGRVGKWGEKKFGQVYRFAASRLCISPLMEERYRQRFGPAGTVLYPIRDDSCAYSAPPPATLASRPLVVGYGGNVFTDGYWETLRHLVDALETVGGKLLLYGPMTVADLERVGLNRPNVELGGYVDQLASVLRREADVLFVPMTFEPEMADNMTVSFPSKLAEYTATGLPLLVYGPPYCSAVRWATEHSGAAEIVTAFGVEGVTAAVSRLTSASYRTQLGEKALELGRRFFSETSVQQVFKRALQTNVDV